jgi:hypothetical protein
MDNQRIVQSTPATWVIDVMYHYSRKSACTDARQSIVGTKYVLFSLDALISDYVDYNIADSYLPHQEFFWEHLFQKLLGIFSGNIY